MRKMLFGSLVTLLSTAVAGGAGSGRAAPVVGDMAPAFHLPGSDGKVHKLSDFKGKQAVVIAWYPKAFTSG